MKQLLTILLLTASIASAEFTDDCVATAGGRRVTVEPDGSFTLHNLPDGQHLMRIYVTCHRANASVDYGRSDLIEVIAGQRVYVGTFETSDMPFVSVASLRLRSTRSVITSVGTQARITPVATLSNGGQLNLTTRELGTIYTTSNPAIATIDPNGFLTATGIGQVIISASNDGVVGSVLVTVTLGDPRTALVGLVTNSSTATIRVDGQTTDLATGPDGSFRFDGLSTGSPLSLIAYDNTATGPRFASKSDLAPVSGGITDAGFLTLVAATAADIQLILGGDGSADGDSDGLSDLGEFLVGTNATLPDTDGNGTLDGDEDPDGDGLTNAAEIAIGSSPLLADTDGDGFSDTDEQILGTALDDPDSRPKHIARALPISYHNSVRQSPTHAQAAPVSYLNLSQPGAARAPVSPAVRFDNQLP